MQGTSRRVLLVLAIAVAGLGTAIAAQPAPETQAPAPAPAQVAAAREMGHTFAQVAAQISPSVVRISVTKTANEKQDPLERFFFGDEGGAPRRQRGVGSGVVIDASGHILTNNHVVEHADTVKVTFVDGRNVKGRVIGADPKSDLAVIQVTGVEVTPAKLGDSDKASVGDFVIAVGNPFGLDHTVTVGVLSAKNRSGFESGQLEDFLQTDASINPGNSGGPLVNLDGEVIGINSMIAGIGTGIGFAVPSSIARPVVAQLIANGKVRRPYLGIGMQDLSAELRASFGKGAPEKGALIDQVTPGAPADRAGLKPGDIVVSIDGTPVDGSRALQTQVLGKKIGDRVKLAVWRDGKQLTIETTTGEMPGEKQESEAEAAGKSSARPPQHEQLGVKLETLTPVIAERIGVGAGPKGAVIVGVRDGSLASDAGLKPGDVILEIDRKPVATAEEAAHHLSVQRKTGHLLRVKRGDAALFLTLGGPND